jgi:hypothetical protein
MRANASSPRAPRRFRSMIELYVLALLVTLVVEVPIVSAFYPDERARMGLVCVVVTSVVMVVVDLALSAAHLSRAATLVAGQAIALVLDAAAYAHAARGRERGWSRALAASAAGNLASYFVGALLF